MSLTGLMSVINNNLQRSEKILWHLEELSTKWEQMSKVRLHFEICDWGNSEMSFKASSSGNRFFRVWFRPGHWREWKLSLCSKGQTIQDLFPFILSSSFVNFKDLYFKPRPVETKLILKLAGGFKITLNCMPISRTLMIGWNPIGQSQVTTSDSFVITD